MAAVIDANTSVADTVWELTDSGAGLTTRVVQLADSGPR